ncbi:ORC ubiquitin ligase 1 [Bombina bombina]|uniref:ORC ubiquitin ligase 1 n=1 Tax=Bombina bombina TaxID=8345 RepID=UPI00235AFEF5|nr:ORC ubiquitin ligase 1 [Bombina bombina]
MAQNVQSVTLALTLPITCHICLGKVRKPVICVNNHVFCSVCIELWLKNNNQCPACRVPITPENPCKDIIGGTSETECMLSHPVRKHLRKARLELLHKEYEEEIESLVNEMEELKGKNIKLEEQLSMKVDPVTVASCNDCNCGYKQTEDKNGIIARTFEEFNNKLLVAMDTTKKLKEDMEKLKEENKRLKNDNNEFVRENLRLKNEVDLRSPQKFGRFTVAALQAKIDQYEREMNRLKKALERSDQYIEELEVQIEILKRPPVQNQKGKSHNDSTTEENVHFVQSETELQCKNKKSGSIPNSDHKICDTTSGPDTNKLGTQDSSSNCTSGLNRDKYIKGENLSNLQSTLGALSEANSTLWDNSIKRPVEDSETQGVNMDTHTPSKVIEFPDCSSPSVSLPFDSLQLNTPNNKPTPPVFDQINLKKPLTYLRKLTFDEYPKKNKTEYLVFEKKNETEPTSLAQSVCEFWSGSQNNCELPSKITERNPKFKEGNLQLEKLFPDKVDHVFLKRLQTISGDDDNRARTTSEMCMDAALLDKISELDNMMSDLEGNKTLILSKEKSEISISRKAEKLQHAPLNENKISENVICSQLNQDSSNETPCTSDSDGYFTTQTMNEQLSCSQMSSFNMPGKEQETWASCSTVITSIHAHASKRKLSNVCSESPTKSFKH